MLRFTAERGGDERQQVCDRVVDEQSSDFIRSRAIVSPYIPQGFLAETCHF